MKLERLHEYLAVFLAMSGGMLLAVYAGRLSGSGHLGVLAMILAALIIGFLLFTLKTRVWMIIPMAWMLTGEIPVLPLPFSIRNLAVFAIFGVTLTLVALKIVRRKPKYNLLDFVLFLNLLYLVTVFVRNPVGTQAFNSEKVGGRPYFEISASVLAYWVLIRASVSARDFRWLPVLVTFGGFIQASIGMITTWFPATAPIIGQFYTGVAGNWDRGTSAGYVQTNLDERQPHLAIFGMQITDAVVSYFQPITVINPIYIGRFLIFAFGAVLLLLSGFRSAIIGMGASYLLASYFRNGLTDLIKSTLIAIPVITVLVVGQGTLFDLPKSAQRALSFLPGKWDETAVGDAEGSTKWRLEMWKYMLTEGKYIDNKLLGDGFGFTRNDMLLMQHFTGSGLGESQEWFMVVGAVHSGPISAIRVAGYVGFALYSWLLFLSAKMAIRLVRRSRSTELFCPALFICIRIIYEPFNYWFIFGGFDSAPPTAIFSIGLLKMLENSFNDYEAEREAKSQPRRPIRSQQAREPLPSLA